MIDDAIVDRLRDCANVVIGIQQVKREVLHGGVSSVVLAMDTDVGYQLSLVKTCDVCNVPIVRVSSSKQLGFAVGIDVKAGCVGILNQSLGLD